MKMNEESASFIYDEQGNLVGMYKANGTLKLYLVKEATVSDLKEIFNQKEV